MYIYKPVTTQTWTVTATKGESGLPFTQHTVLVIGFSEKAIKINLWTFFICTNEIKNEEIAFFPLQSVVGL